MYVCSCCCNSYISENVDHFAAQISRVEALGQSRSKSVKVQLCTNRQRSYDWLTANERM